MNACMLKRKLFMLLLLLVVLLVVFLFLISIMLGQEYRKIITELFLVVTGVLQQVIQLHKVPEGQVHTLDKQCR